jgi:hypothetical protein
MKNFKFKKLLPFTPLVLFVLLLLFAGFLAITQEAGEDTGLEEIQPDDIMFDFQEGEMAEGEPLPEWIPPRPPRWFRSNAGGMTLEEVPSRLAALHNTYALVIDYVPSYEVEPRLVPYYRSGYTVEIRVLYKEGAEYRRQWLLKDEKGITRLNAVFVPPPENAGESAVDESAIDDSPIDESPVNEDAIIDNEIIENNISENNIIEDNPETAEFADAALSGDAIPDIEPPAVTLQKEGPASVGFIEIYNEKTQIFEDRWLFEDDSAIIVNYFYNGSILIKAETWRTTPDVGYNALYTDSYRYNRSFSLRHVERLYHDELRFDPVRLVFPGRVLEAAADRNFLSDKLPLTSDFLGTVFVGEGFRMLYDTDSKGRIMTQTMIDSSDETVWSLVNIWSGDRIMAVDKTEGEDKKRTEYEYDEAGNRIVMRDIHNGVLERVVYTEGENETEELYLNGVIVLKAYWEDGKKISEERVRRR